MTRLTAALAIWICALAAPAMSAAQGPEPPDFQVTAEERARVIDGVLARLNEMYVFPDTAKKMEDAVRARQKKGEYDALTSARDLADRLTADLRAVSRDRHLGVRHFAGGAPDPSAGGPPPARLAEQRDYVRRVNYGFEKVERMQGNIGYIEIRGFVDPALGGETASAAMTFVADTDALIVDLRRNGGGEPAMIAFVQSYLFDEPTHLNDIWERVGNRTQQWWTLAHVPGRRFGREKPVFVLTSRDTFSGGEEFANNLKALKRATLIGETTGGGAHPVQLAKASERFAVGVPFARAVNPITGTNWEGIGVEPDVAMPAAGALEHAYTLALEQVAKRTTNDRQRRQIEQMLQERRKKSE